MLFFLRAGTAFEAHIYPGSGHLFSDHELLSLAQRLFAESGTRPDFFYGDSYQAAIYIDGPHHDYPERRVTPPKWRPWRTSPIWSSGSAKPTTGRS